MIKWIDRGVCSEAGAFRSAYKKYRDRAVVKGIPDTENDGATRYFDSVSQRFHDDKDFRNDMEDQGWRSETICLIDALALMPALENPGRARAERCFSFLVPLRALFPAASLSRPDAVFSSGKSAAGQAPRRVFLMQAPTVSSTVGWIRPRRKMRLES